jgi:hypothetical protein
MDQKVQELELLELLQNMPNANFILDTNSTSATIEIFNEASVPSFSFTDISFSEASSNPEKKCKINITTNHLATNILSPIVAS